MGTIQNAFNQMLGVVAGGIGTAKLLHNQTESNRQSALNLGAKTNEDVNSLNKEIDAYNKESEKLYKDQEDLNKSFESFYNNQRTPYARGKLKGKDLDARLSFYENAFNSYASEAKTMIDRRNGLEERKTYLNEQRELAKSKMGKNKLPDLPMREIGSTNLYTSSNKDTDVVRQNNLQKINQMKGKSVTAGIPKPGGKR